MSDRNEDRLPQELAEMGEMLRENRAQASGLELDAIKLQVKSRARRAPSGQLRRGVNVRSRGVTAILTLLLLGGTTAAGIAGGSGHDNNGGGAADAQYQPPKCTKDMRKCECPKGYSLTVSNGQIVCQRNEPQECDNHGHGHGNDDCDDDHGHGGHGHHHHHQWRQHHNGHWQWCDGDGRNDRDWHDWNGRDDDW
jgi:hypothetical protein